MKQINKKLLKYYTEQIKQAKKDGYETLPVYPHLLRDIGYTIDEVIDTMMEFETQYIIMKFVCKHVIYYVISWQDEIPDYNKDKIINR